MSFPVASNILEDTKPRRINTGAVSFPTDESRARFVTSPCARHRHCFSTRRVTLSKSVPPLVTPSSVASSVSEKRCRVSPFLPKQKFSLFNVHGEGPKQSKKSINQSINKSVMFFPDFWIDGIQGSFWTWVPGDSIRQALGPRNAKEDHRGARGWRRPKLCVGPGNAHSQTQAHTFFPPFLARATQSPLPERDAPATTPQQACLLGVSTGPHLTCHEERGWPLYFLWSPSGQYLESTRKEALGLTKKCLRFLTQFQEITNNHSRAASLFFSTRKGSLHTLKHFFFTREE